MGDPAQLLALVRAQFLPQASSVRHLSGERDLNFLVDVADSPDRYVLKVSDARENPQALALQNAALDHLAQQAPQLPVQRIHRWRDGAHLLALPGPDGVCFARVLTYLPGLPLHEAPPSAAQRRSIGATLAALDRALQCFAHPPVSNEALMWDLQRTAELQSWLPAIQDAQSRAWGEEVFAHYVQQVPPLLATLPQQFLHNDFNPYNLLVNPADPDQVCGVLDFGDMLHGPRVFDVAVAASYQCHAQGQPRIESLLEFMQGYQQANPLSRAELRLLPLLAAVRCAITLCITERRAQRFPENRAYILRNHAVASAGLRALMSCGLAAAADQLLHTLLPTDCHAP
jgi:Ser/Thr protein kinase RdoA (MazF antagonist)